MAWHTIQLDLFLAELLICLHADDQPLASRISTPSRLILHETRL